MLGAGLEPTPLTGRDFKSLSCNGIDSSNPHLYSSDTVNGGKQASAKVVPPASPFATRELPDVYADEKILFLGMWVL